MTGFHIVLIRGIGGASHALVTMKALAAEVEKAGIGQVRSVLATGNFVLESGYAPEEVEECFVNRMNAHGLNRPVLLRRPEQIAAVLAAGAGLPALQTRPERVLVHFFRDALRPDAVPAISARATVETVFTLAGELAVDFAEGISTSALKLEFLERCAGSVGTGRNWNTLGKILSVATAMGWTPDRPA